MARTARIDGGAAAIAGRRMQIGHRLDPCQRRADRGTHRGLLDAGADERCGDGVEPQRNGGDRADADGGTAADAVLRRVPLAQPRPRTQNRCGGR